MSAKVARRAMHGKRPLIRHVMTYRVLHTVTLPCVSMALRKDSESATVDSAANSVSK